MQLNAGEYGLEPLTYCLFKILLYAAGRDMDIRLTAAREEVRFQKQRATRKEQETANECKCLLRTFLGRSLQCRFDNM